MDLDTMIVTVFCRIDDSLKRVLNGRRLRQRGRVPQRGCLRQSGDREALEMNFSITPENFLRDAGVEFKRRDRWLSLKICPFCGGGRSGETYSFSVHIRDGNYFCHRNKCGERGSFWKLIEFYGRNPRDYRGEFQPKKKKKKFIYGK